MIQWLLLWAERERRGSRDAAGREGEKKQS